MNVIECTWWMLLSVPDECYWAYLMNVILSVPDECYWAYLMNVIECTWWMLLSVPDECYSRNTSYTLSLVSTFLSLCTKVELQITGLSTNSLMLTSQTTSVVLWLLWVVPDYDRTWLWVVPDRKTNSTHWIRHLSLYYHINVYPVHSPWELTANWWSM
jgi:hypothetical protein